MMWKCFVTSIGCNIILYAECNMDTSGLVKLSKTVRVHLTRKDPTHEEWQRSMCEILKKTGATKRQIAEYKRTGEMP